MTSMKRFLGLLVALVLVSCPFLLAGAAEAPPAKLTVEVFDRSDVPSPYTIENNPLAQYIIARVKEDLNIELTFMPVPRSEEVSKLNVMMVGGPAPDIVFTYDTGLLADYALKGGLTDLTPYVEEHGQNILKALGEEVSYCMMYDKLYTVRGVGNIGNFSQGKHISWLRTDLLEKHQIAMPKNLPELYAAMKIIKEKEPDVIPFAMATTTNERYYENMVLSFADYKDEAEAFAYNTDNIRLVSPGVKEGYRELNKWYNEGLVSVDFAIDSNATQFKSDVANGKAFAFVEDQIVQEWMMTAMLDNPDITYTPTNYFLNKDGQYRYNKYLSVGISIAVPKANEANAATAIRYLDWMIQEKNMLDVRGGFGLGLSEYDASGELRFLDDVAMREKGVSPTMLGDFGLMAMGAARLYDDPTQQVAMSILKYSGEKRDFTPLLEAYLAAADEGTYYLEGYMSTPSAAQMQYGSNLRTMIQNMAARLISVPADQFDALWDSEYASLVAAGLNDVVKERTEYFKAQ